MTTTRETRDLARGRLDRVDQLLLAAGWTKPFRRGWMPPDTLAELVAQHYGFGPMSRVFALRAQIELDEIASEDCRPINPSIAVSG